MPVIFVEGVVNGPPIEGGFPERRSLWFDVMPWRLLKTGELPELPLRLDVRVSDKELRHWMPRIVDQTALEFTVGKISQLQKSCLRASARLPLRRVEGSPELRAAHAAYLRPVTVHDDELGTLDLDRRRNWLTTKLELGGRSCTLAVVRREVPASAARDRRDLARARRAVARLRERWGTITERLVRSMLPLYNDGWRERRRVITAEQLLDKARPELVVIHDDGITSLQLSDGHLFEDNAILVRLDARGRILECCLTNPEALSAVR